MSTSPKIYRPTPHRPFDHNERPPQPPSPLMSPTYPNDAPSRTQSIMNLTSSTLHGIYAKSSYGDRDFEPASMPSTPWGTGSETPQRKPSIAPVARRKSFNRPLPPPSTAAVILGMGWRSLLLFGMGMGYGLLVRHLHDDRRLAPFQVEGLLKPTNDWRYLVFWGVAGVALGSLLPWVDTLFQHEELETPIAKGIHIPPENTAELVDRDGLWGADWTPVVRSVGAFVGIAYAIRKLPWSSPLQASLTLALVNPVLWYLIDRSTPGFLLSTAVGATGTALLLASNPNMMPSPASPSSASRRNGTMQHTPVLGMFGVSGWDGYVSRESIEGGIWILSVLFCSCVCFGNIGRRLALSGKGRRW